MKLSPSKRRALWLFANCSTDTPPSLKWGKVSFKTEHGERSVLRGTVFSLERLGYVRRTRWNKNTYHHCEFMEFELDRMMYMLALVRGQASLSDGDMVDWVFPIDDKYDEYYRRRRRSHRKLGTKYRSLLVIGDKKHALELPGMEEDFE